jgi:nitrite reductase (NADH) large subunit
MATKEKLVIVGNGMAGGKLIEEILNRDPERYAITVIGDEPCGNYNRIKLVVKLKEPDLPDFFLNTPEWYAEHGVQALLGSAVAGIDRAAKTVALENGQTLSYDQLVLATGSHPFIPPMTGLDLPGVFALRKLEDVDRIRAFLKDKSHMTVLGGGLLGLELALMLRLIGKQVTVSHLMPSLMELQLPEEAGGYLKRHLENLGVRFVMGTYITGLLGSTAGVEEARFKDGSFIKTDAVFFNCGIRPNKELAEKTGLVFNKGVAVNDRLQTSDPFIYACGECIEFKGQTWGLVAPVYEQSRTLAAVLCGAETVYAPSAPVPARLKSDIPVISMGRFNPEPGDEVAHYTDPHGAVYKQLIIRDDTIKGAVLVGEDLNADAIELHYSAKIPVPARRADLLFPGARAGEGFIDGAHIPDDAQVCDCNGVSAGKIRKAIGSGSDTLYKVMQTTRAGTGCGNCKSKIKALLISEVGELRADPAEKYYAAGVAMDRDELTAFIRANNLRSVSQVLNSVPNAVDDSKTRMAIDYLLDYIWRSDYVVEDDSRCANDRYSGNIQKDGRFSVIPNMAGGQTTSQHLRAIADAADKYNALIKVTGADRIGLYSVDKKDLKNVWNELQMGSGHAFTKCFRACKSCMGSTHCRFGLMDSLELGRVLGERYRGLRSPAKIKMGVSGCPRNCSEATIKDFGVVAVEGGWDVYIGGNGGSQVYVAQKITQVKTDEEVIRIADRFYEYYCRHAKYGERTAHFVERLSAQTVADAILHAPENELLELEEGFSKLRDNYKDPWETAIEAMGDDMSEEVLPETDDGFTQVALVEDVSPGTSQEFIVNHHPVAVFHTRSGEWIAADGLCPHEQGPLVDSIYGDGRLVCPIHSYSFDVKTGVCDNPDIGVLKIYTLAVRDGRVLVKP